MTGETNRESEGGNFDLSKTYDEVREIESIQASLESRRESLMKTVIENLESRVGQTLGVGGEAYGWQDEQGDWEAFANYPPAVGEEVLPYGEWEVLRAEGSTEDSGRSMFMLVVLVPEGIDGHDKIVLLSDMGDLRFSPDEDPLADSVKVS